MGAQSPEGATSAPQLLGSALILCLDGMAPPCAQTLPSSCRMHPSEQLPPDGQIRMCKTMLVGNPGADASFCFTQLSEAHLCFSSRIS